MLLAPNGQRPEMPQNIRKYKNICLRSFSYTVFSELEVPNSEEAWHAEIHGVAKNRTRLSD